MVNIHRISHYLNGDFPPHYRARYNIITFCHSAKAISGGRLTDEILHEMSNFGFRNTEMFLAVFNFLNESERRELALECIPYNIYEEITQDKFQYKPLPYCTITVHTTEDFERLYSLVKLQNWEVAKPIHEFLVSGCKAMSAFLVHALPKGGSVLKQVFYTDETNPFETQTISTISDYISANNLSIPPIRTYEGSCGRQHCESVGKVKTTVTKDTHLHTKFLNPMNYYNASVILSASAIAELPKKSRTEAKIVLIPLTTMFAASEENVKAQLTRKLDASVDVDDVEFLISPIFE